MSKREGCSIGEFAKRTGTSIRTLQYYDEIGLLKPGKNVSSGHRVYSGKDILTLQKIMSLKLLWYSQAPLIIKSIEIIHALYKQKQSLQRDSAF